MAKKTGEGLINHCVGVRYRLTGSGGLKTTVRDMGNGFQELSSTTMATTTSTLPFRLANFRGQGMQIEFGTTEIDETFNISRIIAYIKPTATGYPQV